MKDILYTEKLDRFNDFDITIKVFSNNNYKFNSKEELDIMCGYKKPITFTITCSKYGVELSKYFQEDCIVYKENYILDHVNKIKNSNEFEKIILDLIGYSIDKVKNLYQFVLLSF